MSDYKLPPRIDASALAEEADPEEPKLKRSTRAKNAVLDKTPDQFKNPTDLQVRLRTGAVYITVTVLCIVFGRIPMALMLAATAGICAGEFYYMLRQDAKLPNEFFGIVASVLFPIVMCFAGLEGAAGLMLLLAIALLVWYVFYTRASITDVCVSFFGAVYTGFLLGTLVLVRTAVPGWWGALLVLLIFSSVWVNDGAAYLFGRKFGKHKLAPQISPKKSREGFFAGLVASMAVWCIISFIPAIKMGIPMALVFGLVCGVTGVLGDLTESRIKRNSGCKDSGTLMPGHGGLLARTDSLFLVAAVAVVLLILGGCIPDMISWG